MVTIKTNSRRDLLIHLGIIGCLSAIILLSFFFLYLPWRTNHGESITVPDLKGRNAGELATFLEEHDLRYEVQDSDYVSNMPPLSVKDQYPKAGSKVKQGRKIYVTVIARNPPMVAMPNLIDMSYRSAQTTLQSFGLEATEPVYKPNLCMNCVLAQQLEGKDIKTGTRIPKGTKITLVVGNGAGNELFNVPNYVGLPLEEAKAAIVGQNLELGSILSDTDSDKPAGTVTRQNPPAVEGNKIRQGELVDLWVSGTAPAAPASNPSNQ
jgi:beta-lactam-binding protein with PASTA domain